MRAYSAIVIVSLLAVGIAGCREQPTIVVSRPSEAMVSTRVTVARLGVFEDNAAYGGRRVVYLIVDKHTGVEYIGVTGVGISEVGEHKISNGKTTVSVEDER